MGFSSGKLSAYLYRGLPIIVNDITGPRNLIEAYRCGICVQDMNDIASAIKEIINNYDFYSMNAIKCFDEELEFTKHFRHVIDHIDKI